MKRVFKVAIILIILSMMFGQLSVVKAEDDGTLVVPTNDVLDINANEFKPDPPNIDPELSDRAGTIVAIIRNVGIVVAVIALMLIAIKEMTGSLEERSNLKKALPGYIIGIVLVVSVATIPSILYGIMKDFNQ